MGGCQLLQGDWLWCGKGIRLATTPSTVKGSFSRRVVCGPAKADTEVRIERVRSDEHTEVLALLAGAQRPHAPAGMTS